MLVDAKPPMPVAGASPAELLQRFCADRDQAAFTELVRRFGPLVLRVSRRMLDNEAEAEDVFQATFVVLARKASVIARPETLGPWLHGVACRLALKARGQTQRRQRRECGGMDAALVQCQAQTAAPQDDLRSILDEELDRLPETYRVPLVLCYLEGRSQSEAAQHLGCQEPALRMRLMRGRELLRERLAHRGLACGVAALAAALGPEAAPAAGLAVLPGAEPSPRVAELAEGLAPAGLRHNRRRLLALAAIVLLGGVAAWVFGPSKPLHRVWRFEKGPADDLRVERGRWQHRVDGPGLMTGAEAVVALPVEMPHRPFAVTVKWRLDRSRPLVKEARVLPIWARAAQPLPRQVWAKIWKDQWNPQATVVSRTIFKDHWAAMYLDGQLTSIHEYAQDYPSKQIVLMLQNCAVEEIELKELSSTEIPAELLDIRRARQPLVPGLTNDI